MIEAFRIYEPTASLRPFVRLIWSMHVDSPDRTHVFPILPQGLTELVLLQGGRTTYRSDDGTQRPLPRMTLAGAITRRLDLTLSGVLDAVGLQFYPTSASLFGLSRPHALADTVTPLEWLAGADTEVLEEALRRASTAAARVGALEEWLLSRFTPPRVATRGVRMSAELIMHRRGDVRITDICRQVGLSRRSLERGFRDHVGLPPKLFCELLRFQSALHAHRSHDLTWSSVASKCGYADQAHLVREFTRFAGVSPRRLLSGIHPITACFAGIEPHTS